jgi:hypothetical protein
MRPFLVSKIVLAKFANLTYNPSQFTRLTPHEARRRQVEIHSMHEGDELTEPIHILSLGAGVQSSTLALMAAKGEVTPMPSAAIFADTQAEPASVYKWLDWLEAQLPFPVYHVSKGDLASDSLEVRRSGRSGLLYMRTMIPYFTRAENGDKGIVFRKCTRDYKLDPIFRKVKELANIPRACKEVRAIQWIGISTDEAQRMKDSQNPWAVNRWPLIEKGMSRADCLRWMEVNDYPQPPRSACVFCPYHSDREWQRLKIEEPEEFARAVEFESKSQEAARNQEALRGVPFLHSSLRPLSEIDFGASSGTRQIDLFNNECEGMCGV